METAIAIGCVVVLGVIGIWFIVCTARLTTREKHLTTRVDSLVLALRDYKREVAELHHENKTNSTYCIACNGIMPRNDRRVMKYGGPVLGLESAHMQCEGEAKAIWKARGL